MFRILKVLFNEEDEDYQLDNELCKYLIKGTISDKLKLKIDERLKVCRRARDKNEYWNYNTSNARYDKALLLSRFKEEVDYQCSPVVWHTYHIREDFVAM